MSRPAALKGRGRGADAIDMFRARILPAIVVIWGALIVFRLFSEGTSGGAYGAGGLVAGMFGLVMVGAGVRALLRT